MIRCKPSVLRWQLALEILVLVSAAALPAAEPANDASPISYYRQVRPLFQARCHGCHQPAKASGEYVMTSFPRLLAGGESGEPVISPGQPDGSYLVDLITPKDGFAEMPQDGPPLSEAEVARIRRWIAEGAADDTPAGAQQDYDRDHPPRYTRPPVITSLDFSPDGRLLAVAGYHEVLLTSTDDQRLVGRLVGMSERIESVKFSPDGRRLAVTGGLPARRGEVQVWDVEDQSLLLSAPVTFDTLYGGCWSPDGRLIAFGCSDNSVRAIDAESGRQVLFQGAHDDWVLDTVFSRDGSQLISVGRDMTCKLIEVATERFVDNITSITPGALTGGIHAVARHPEREEVVIGGADGQPKVYRVFRETARRIGDDANLIRRLPAMEGRIFDVAVSSDGRRIAACSSLDGQGQVCVYSYEFDTSLPESIKKIESKTVTERSPEERAALDDYHVQDVKRLAEVPVPGGGVYGVAFQPDGRRLAAAGADGVVRLIDPETGQIVSQFSPAPLEREPSSRSQGAATAAAGAAEQTEPPEPSPVAVELLESLQVEPEAVALTNRFDYAQLIVTGRLANGDLVDVTRLAQAESSSPAVSVSRRGLVRPLADGQAVISLRVGSLSVEVPATVRGAAATYRADFLRDVNPVLTRLGCNQGTCHGAAKGKNGFKLSLRGYDPLLDVRSLTDDLACRRVNAASPDQSLMLLKPSGAAPHAGGQLTRPGESYYEILRSWIASGARIDLETPRVTGVQILPQNPVIASLGGRQQVRVLAAYSDGRTRDVTCEAFIESGDTEIATADRFGLMTALRRGEAPLLARFEGAYAATTLTVMGDRRGFAWEDPPCYGRIDELSAAKWKRMKIQPSPPCSDAEFLRRAQLDLTGLPPTADRVRAFLADDRDARVKRDELVDELIGSDEYVEHWTNKWSDLLQVNRKFLGVEGAAAFRQWIRSQVAQNTPYDQFVRQILSASGSNKDHPASSYFKILRTPEATMENTTQLFLAVRFNCNRCHDHPFERWTQDQYYHTSAFFAQVGLKADPAGGDKKIPGTAVEDPTPLYEVVYDRTTGDVTHLRTGKVAEPEFPFACDYAAPADASRRRRLAAWLTAPDNRYFARSYVNRLWGYLMGRGLIEPIDDIRAGNPATNPELLDYLERQFIESGFDVRRLLRLICTSRTYQLSIVTNRWNEDDQLNYSHAVARRLPAEVLYDAVHRATGSQSQLPDLPPGSRAAQLPDAGSSLPNGFLASLGRPARESACECERSNDLQLGAVLTLINGPTVADAIADPDNEITRLVASEPDDARLVSQLYLQILNRPATKREIESLVGFIGRIDEDHRQLVEQLKQREQYVASLSPQWEQQRLDAIRQAEQELAAYETELAPRLAEQTRLRSEQTEKLRQELEQYEAGLAEQARRWEQQQASDVEWIPLEYVDLSASNGATLIRQPDRSLLVQGKDGKGAYLLTAHTQVRGVTGIRLEALTDSRLAGGGPGLSANGNFVLTELELRVAPASAPQQLQPLTLKQGKADFTQQNFDINQAADGQNGGQQGWAVSPSGGVPHWATFETGEPIDFEGGAVLKFTLHQNHNANAHRLGRFRLSITTHPAPIGLSLPEELKAIVSTPEQQRVDQQRETLLAYFRGVDPGYYEKKQALAQSQQPPPEDPGRQRLREALDYARRPVPEDSLLVQLRRDVAQSEQQLASRRLTVAQDFAWALLNSPSFLFNH